MAVTLTWLLLFTSAVTAAPGKIPCEERAWHTLRQHYPMKGQLRGEYVARAMATLMMEIALSRSWPPPSHDMPYSTLNVMGA